MVSFATIAPRSDLVRKLPVYRRLPYSPVAVFDKQLKGVGIRPFLNPCSLTPLPNSTVIKLEREISIKTARSLASYIREIGINEFATYGDSLHKVIREPINTGLAIPQNDPMYIKRSTNCKYVDEALGISTTKGQALFFNLGNVSSAFDYLYYNHQRFMTDKTFNRGIREGVLPDGAALCVYQVKDLMPWSHGNVVYMPLISISEVIGYLAMKNYREHKVSSVPQELASSWAGRSVELSPEKEGLIKDHIRVIKYLLGNDPQIDTELEGDFESLANIGRRYIATLQREGRDFNALKDKLGVLLGHKVDFTELIALNTGLLREDNPNKPAPSMIFLGRELGYVKDFNVNQLGLSFLYCGYAYHYQTPMITLLHPNNVPLMSMAEFAKLNDRERMERQVIESTLIKFFTLLKIASLGRQEKIQLVDKWNELIG